MDKVPRLTRWLAVIEALFVILVWLTIDRSVALAGVSHARRRGICERRRYRVEEEYCAQQTQRMRAFRHLIRQYPILALPLDGNQN